MIPCSLRSFASLIRPLFAVCLLLAADGATAEEYDGLPKHFFELVAKGDMGAAIEYGYATTASTLDADHVDAFRKQIVKGLATVGPYAFHELIHEEKVGTRFVRLTYAIGYEKSPIEVTLLLYRPKDKWSVHNISYKDLQTGAFGGILLK